MKKTLTKHDIARELHEDANANWSWTGALALAEYLDNLDEDCGTDTEFCKVAIRCDFAQYDSALDAAAEYGFEPDPDQDEDEKEESALEYLRDNTQVIEFDGGVIVQGF